MPEDNDKTTDVDYQESVETDATPNHDDDVSTSRERNQEIYNLYKQGMPPAQLAEKYDRSERSIIHIVRLAEQRERAQKVEEEHADHQNWLAEMQFSAVLAKLSDPDRPFAVCLFDNATGQRVRCAYYDSEITARYVHQEYVRTLKKTEINPKMLPKPSD